MARSAGERWQRFWGVPAPVAIASVAAAMGGYLTYGLTVVVGAIGAEFGAVGEARPGSVEFYLGLSGATLGAVLLLVRLGSLLSAPLTRLADVRGRRPILILAFTIGSAASLATASAAALWMFVVFQIVARTGLSAAGRVVETIAAEESDRRARSRALASIAAAWAIGAGAASVVYALTKRSSLGWRGLYLGAIAALAVIPFLRRSVTETKRFAALAYRNRHGLRDLWRPPFRRRLVLVCLVDLFIVVQASPAGGFALVFAEKVRGIPSGAIAAMVLVAGAPGLLGLVASGWLSDRLGRRTVASGAVMLGAACTVGFYAGPRWAMAPSYWLLVTAAALAAPALGALGAELFPTSARATAAAVTGTVSVASAAVSYQIFGLLLDALGGFGRAATVISIAPLIAVVCMMLLPETAHHEMEEISPDTIPTVGAGLAP